MFSICVLLCESDSYVNQMSSTVTMHLTCKAYNHSFDS